MKKNSIILLISLIIVALGTSCRKTDLGTPEASTVADFTVAIDNDGYAPCVALFTNKSINATAYLWDFGGGITTTETNPVVSFTTPGIYTVRLTCTPVNNLYYNQLTKTMVINIKDPGAGKQQVLYYTTRTAAGAGVHMVILGDGPPLVQDFEPTIMTRPYGMACDTVNSKVYVTDYSSKVIYRFDADGKNPEKILDAAVPGQELTADPQAIIVHGDKIYWGRNGGINRANLDGSNPEVYLDLSASGPEYPLDMQLDPISNKLYLVNDKVDFPGGYFSMNFDGTGIAEHVNDIDGTAIEVNFNTGKTYLAAYGVAGTPIIENGIYQCNLDGSMLVKIGDFGSKATWGMTIDHKRNKLFWGYKISNSNPDGKIIRSNLDGSGQEDWLTGVSPHAIQVVWIKL
jgi:PKD repeat protein